MGTSRLKPFFSYYGSKWRIAPKYPRPKWSTLIEPFAGAASYSLLYPDHDVFLTDVDPILAGLWTYLIKVSEKEIRSLPDLPVGVDVGTLDVCQEARWLIGFWLNKGAASPCRTMSKWGAQWPKQFWGPRIRERVASQIQYIRHWRVGQCEYSEIPNARATWFVDPPYQVAGKHYKHSRVDFPHLADWCRSRNGQAIVCENQGAEWLPFVPFCAAQANESATGGKVSKEAIWSKGD